MHIKEVNITGFRSYREATSIDAFDRRHNVIVGRNGSGKSNFFLAIQFVLSDDFSSLKADQRMSLLHEGAGQRSTTARVEIVIDNSDRRIPAVENAEVRIVRQVGQKKDQYFIDGKVVPRSEVVNLMESAGFSRSNPYYIVKQGKINELATAPDSHRLKLLKEVAGTRVYDERKDESMKILKETQLKTKKVEDLLKFIDERLKTLEEEKDDLKEYQKWDKTKRSIEYTLCDAEINETKRKMEKFTEQRDDLTFQSMKMTEQLTLVKDRNQRAATEKRKLDNRFKGLKEEKEILSTEQTEKFEKRTQLELMIKDIKEDVEKEKDGRNNAEDELRRLKGDIAEKKEELDSIIPRYKKLWEEEKSLESDLRIADNRSKELFAKQGHRDQFASAAERDNYLRKEIRSQERAIQEIEEVITTLENNEADNQRNIDNLNGQLSELGVQLQENHNNIDKANTEHARLKLEYDRAVVAQLDATRAEKSVRDALTATSGEISQMEHVLRTIVARPTMQGVESVRKAVKYFADNNDRGQNDDIVNGYYGIVLDLIACDPAYFQAIEVTAGNRLFNHVVSDDRVATKILQQVNREGLPGECNFFPLNRMANPQKKTTQSEDARPMLDVLDYDPIFEPVCKNIFNTVAIVRNMAVGSILARQEGFDCVTMEGDQVSRRGALTGGYLDTKRNKMEVNHNISNYKEQMEENQRKLEEAKQVVNEKMKAVEKVRTEIDRIENDLRKFKENHRTLTEIKYRVGVDLTTFGTNAEKFGPEVLQTKNRLKELRAQKQNSEAQIGSDLQSQLSKDEQQECERLQKEMREKKHQLEAVARSRAALEDKKTKLENQLSTNLLRKRDNLQSKINDIAVDEKQHNLQAEIADHKSVTLRLSEISKRMRDLDDALQEYEEESERLTREMEDCQEQIKDLDQQIQEFSKQADLICTKQSALQTKREESLKKIRDLGSLPTDAFAKYQGMQAKQLEKKLAECLNELKKYENVNKRALDQFVAAASQKEDLTKRMEEQEKSQKAIEELLAVMENRKYEAIQLTFKQVSKNFKDVFSKLVPSGVGGLVIQMKELQHNEEPNVERYTGIGIKVSFNGSSETREMQQLSGGQKSLVALALIFAIQIDAALDAQHRKAVADMIHELSESAQFITTTFRPELLEHAQKFYGVKFRNKVSHIDVVPREQAYDFVEDDQTHG